MCSLQQFRDLTQANIVQLFAWNVWLISTKQQPQLSLLCLFKNTCCCFVKLPCEIGFCITTDICEISVFPATWKLLSGSGTFGFDMFVHCRCCGAFVCVFQQQRWGFFLRRSEKAMSYLNSRLHMSKMLKHTPTNIAWRFFLFPIFCLFWHLTGQFV